MRHTPGMTLQVVGAGVGRTGTTSLKAALEQLLGGRCYHMFEVLDHPGHVGVWSAAAAGDPVDWDALFDGFTAAVDWPVASFWPELTAMYPDALVLLSNRESPEVWWKSASATVFEVTRRPTPPGMEEWRAMVDRAIGDRFTPDVHDRDAAIAAYERHNARVRAEVPVERLLEWQPGDGWEPICERLGLPVPDAPFPHANTTDEFQAMLEGA